jgi:hypothetical protein
MKHAAIYIILLPIITACRHSEKNSGTRTVKNDSANVKAPVPLTDSIKLLRHLDSLPKIKFPFKSEAYNVHFDSMNLSEFKNKKLFKIPVKLIPTVIGSGGIDDHGADSTFNLVEKNYKGAWDLIEKKPTFIVVEINSIYFQGVKLVTLTYDLHVIDAINIAAADPLGHYPWFADRHAIINKDLTILLQHEYIMNETDNDAETETSEEKWYIDETGHFRKNKHQ